MIKTLRCGLISFLSLLLLGCPTMQPKYLEQPEVILAEGSFTHSSSGMTFPPRVGDFHRSILLQYDAEGLDVSAGYDLVRLPERIAATVYVYPAPPLISIGSPPEVVAGARARLTQIEYEACKQVIFHGHAGASLIEEGAITLPQCGGSYSGLMATFEYEDKFTGRRRSLRSHLYLFCYVGGKWAIKYRFTHLKDFDAVKEIEQFMQNLSWTLTNS